MPAGSDLTLLGFLHRDVLLLVFLRGGGSSRFSGCAAVFSETLGDVINVLVVFGRTVVLHMVHPDGPPFDLETRSMSVPEAGTVPCS